MMMMSKRSDDVDVDLLLHRGVLVDLGLRDSDVCRRAAALVPLVPQLLRALDELLAVLGLGDEDA